ncbi:MAG: Periplasmic binding protein [Syntrophorhabdaceae bacterium PtaU1.Bin034]|nr:MAG: Periplasmic binding protein [Syntrophorhabdaceae bacterium PtaU1.Bin034]
MEGIELKMMKKKLLLLMLAVFLSAFHGLAFLAYAADYKIITDMDDNKIEVPVNPRRIACMHGVSSDRIIMLGKGGSLTLMMKPSPWAYKLYPEIRNVHTTEPPFSGNVERMLKLKVDLVLYSPFPGEAEKYKAAGIKTACGFSAQKRPRTMEDFMDNFKRQVMFFGDLLGPEAKPRAIRYCEYFDRKIGQILSVTSKIRKKDRPTVYYGGRSGNLLSSQGKASIMHWLTEVSGGNFLPQAYDGNFTEVNMERVWSWNPDIILISGWGNTLESVKKNPNWASMKAVKNGKLYSIPNGVFAWDYASGESILLAIYMAKIFHPDLFRNWDMAGEMKTFYSEVYGKTITDKDAERILKCLPPM